MLTHHVRVHGVHQMGFDNRDIMMASDCFGVCADGRCKTDESKESAESRLEAKGTDQARSQSSGNTRYQLMGEGSGGAIGTGSFGKVYAAVDKVTGATVAVKRQSLPSESAQK